MESSEILGLSKQDSPEGFPPLSKFINGNEVTGLDRVEEETNLDNQYRQAGFQARGPSATETEAAAVESKSGHFQSQKRDSVSISMPSSEVYLESNKRVLLREHDGSIAGSKQETFHSQSMRAVSTSGLFPYSPEHPPKDPRIHDRLKDKRFDSFRTWSGKLGRQLSNLRGFPRENEPEASTVRSAEVEMILPAVHRSFDALEGRPALDTLRASEEILLPEDRQWPFLLRYPISSFGICLGVSSQAILWKTLATSPSTKFLHVSLVVNLVLWYISIALVATVTFTYVLKVIFYFEAVRREYNHPTRVNFFFTAFISLIFLALSIPTSVAQNLPKALWYILTAPIFCLNLDVYGQWMFGGNRRLSKVANPTHHIAVAANFVVALLGASMGLKEGPKFFFSIGLSHYVVLFVTLYQRLPSNETLPKELHPVYFLVFATPFVASLAWASIQHSFDDASRIAFFTALFLYLLLAIRVKFFRGFRFSLAWWAYTFPMDGAAIAAIHYTDAVPNIVTKSLTVLLTAAGTLTVISLLGRTIFHALVLRDLFPNDIAIAISHRRPKTTRKLFHFQWRPGRSSEKDIGNYLRFVDDESKDIEASDLPPPGSYTTAAVDTSTGTAEEVQGNQAPAGPATQVCPCRHSEFHHSDEDHFGVDKVRGSNKVLPNDGSKGSVAGRLQPQWFETSINLY